MINRDVPLPPPGANADDCHTYGRLRDPIGHRVHYALALAYLTALPLAEAPKEITFVLLVGYALLRLPNTWRTYVPLARNRVLVLLGAWMLWQAIAVGWSPDRGEGLETLRAFRVVILPLALWPVLDRPTGLVTAFLAGVLLQNGIQVGQRFGLIEADAADGGRSRGLLHPIVTGTMCLSALCWHAIALMQRGWQESRLRLAFALLGAIAAAVGLLLSGSRGPWIAAAVTVPLLLVVTAVRRPESRRRVLATAGLGLLAAVVAWPIAGSLVTARVAEAGAEWTERDPYSSVGLRLHLWSWAWEMHNDTPLLGVGSGGFRAALGELPSFQETVASRPDDPGFHDWIEKGHAHSTYLQALACTGWLGGLLLAALLAALVIRAAREPSDHLYADGVPFVLIAWMVGAAFDAYQENTHQFGLLMFLAALTLACRPRPVLSSDARPAGAGAGGEASGAASSGSGA